MAQPDEADREAREELLAGYVLDALDSDAERDEARRLIASDPEAAQLVTGWEQVAAGLARAGAVTPPEAVRQAVLERIGSTPQDTVEDPAPQAGALHTGRRGTRRPASAPTTPASARTTTGPGRGRAGSGRGRRGWLVVVAAAVAVAIAIPTGVAIQQHERAELAQARQEQLEQLLRAPDATVSTTRLSAGGSLSVVRADGRALLLGSDLPALPADRTYQLWTIAGGEAPVSAGLGGRGGDFTLDADAVDRATTVAITVEPAGGSTAPSTRPLGSVGG